MPNIEGLTPGQNRPVERTARRSGSDPEFRLPPACAVERCSRAIGEQLSDVRDRSITVMDFDIQPRELKRGSKTGKSMWLAAQSAFNSDFDISNYSEVARMLKRELPKFIYQNPAWKSLEQEITGIIQSACDDGDVVDGRHTLILTDDAQTKHGFSDRAIRGFVYFAEEMGIHQIIIESFEGQHDLVVAVHPDGRRELNICSGSMRNESVGDHFGDKLYTHGGGYLDDMVDSEDVAHSLDLGGHSTRNRADSPHGEEHVIWARMSRDDDNILMEHDEVGPAVNYVRSFVGDNAFTMEKVFPAGSLNEFWDGKSEISKEDLAPTYGAGVPPHLRHAFFKLPGVSIAPPLPKVDKRKRPIVVFEEPVNVETLRSEPWATQKMGRAMNDITMFMPGDSHPLASSMHEIYLDRYGDEQCDQTTRTTPS